MKKNVSLKVGFGKKKEVAEKLINALFTANLALLVIKTQIGFFDRFLRNKRRIYSDWKACVFLFSGIHSVKDAVNFLLHLRLWHMPVFHMIVIESTMVDFVKQTLLQNKKFDAKEKAICEKAVAYIEPLDDELFFYTNEQDKILNILINHLGQSVICEE